MKEHIATATSFADLYKSGQTQREIAKQFGVHQMTISRWLRATGIKCRAGGSKINGAAHPNWKGNNVTYKTFHKRLYNTRGQPRKCEICGTEDHSRRYDWANLSGRYDDPNDYARMCWQCHMQYDGLGQHRNKKGQFQ
jgi:hypothetical protein